MCSDSLRSVFVLGFFVESKVESCACSDSRSVAVCTVTPVIDHRNIKETGTQYRFNNTHNALLA